MRSILLIALFFILIGFLSWIIIFAPTFHIRLREGWSTLTYESKKILGWGKNVIPPEEKRIREEVILKKMEEASASQDWRALAPEYPRPKKFESPKAEEKMKALKDSSAFKEMDKELKEYLKKKEDLFNPEAPTPSLKEATESLSIKDKGTEKVMARLLSAKTGNVQERPLDENLKLGIKGPLVSRKILERPTPPPIKVTFYFYPDSPGAEPPSIAGRAFKLERKQFRSNPSIDLLLTGEFSAGSEAKGVLEVSAAGSGCKGAAKSTWTARREAVK